MRSSPFLVRASGYFLAIAIVTSMLSGQAWAETGVVALKPSGCDYYLINTNRGYVLAEWWGGYDPDRGDEVVGSFSSYGFRTVFFGQDQSEGRIYIEDFWLSIDDALEQLSDKCD